MSARSTIPSPLAPAGHAFESERLSWLQLADKPEHWAHAVTFFIHQIAALRGPLRRA